MISCWIATRTLSDKRLQRTGISGFLIENLPHDAVVARAAEARRSMPREGFEYEANPSLDDDVLLVRFLRLHDSSSDFGNRAESEDVKERHKHA